MVFANCYTIETSMEVSIKIMRTANMDLTYYPRYKLKEISPCCDCEHHDDCFGEVI